MSHPIPAPEIPTAIVSRPWSVSALALLATAVCPSPLPAGEVTALVLDSIQRARSREGVQALARRPKLDAVAREVAREVARRPHADRLVSEQPISTRLRDAEYDAFSGAFEHLALEQGNADPATRFVSSWYSYDPSWQAATSAEYDAVGLATVTATDGWTVLVAVLVQDLVVPGNRRAETGPHAEPEIDLAAFERATVAAVNEIRLDRGLTPLETTERLAAVARAHSNDMARRGYFGHFSPEEQGPRQRVEQSGLTFRKMGENVQMSRGDRDPVQGAVDSWMNSPGHRKTMLTPEFRLTGVGVAMSAEGAFYFTQLFLLLPNGAGPAGGRN